MHPNEISTKPILFSRKCNFRAPRHSTPRRQVLGVKSDIDAAIGVVMSVLFCTAEEAREALIQSNMDPDAALLYIVKDWD